MFKANLYTLRDKEAEKTKYRKSFVNTIFVVFCILFIFVFLATYVFFGIHVSGWSMENTLKDGDVLIASSVIEPDYNSIIVISGKKIDNGKDEWIIKRLIGKPGDIVEINEGEVFLTRPGEERKKLNEPYIKEQKSTFPLSPTSKTKWELGEDEYFFLGDNRKNSSDSRYYGTCSRKQIVGVVTNFGIAIKGFITGVYDFFGLTGEN